MDRFRRVMDSKVVDLQLDALALVRSRVHGDDESFNFILNEKSTEDLKELLSMTAAFSAVTIAELLSKLHRAVSGRPEYISPRFKDSNSYLDSAIHSIIPTKDQDDSES